MTRKRYSDETKAAVMAALLTGQSVNAVAEQYKIPKGTVSGWNKIASTYRTDNDVKKVKVLEIGVLLTEYLQTNLIALKAQAEQFADKEWLRTQDADAAAVLHGVLTDKAIRLLEAFGDSDTEAEN